MWWNLVDTAVSSTVAAMCVGSTPIERRKRKRWYNNEAEEKWEIIVEYDKYVVFKCKVRGEEQEEEVV